jgi:release factor glutamine methyltransferase
VADAPSCLEAGGLLVLEVSDQQAPATRALLEAAGYAEIEFHRDLAGIDRVVAARHVQPAHSVS